ncbi:MAG TPA: hypothetical protein VL625_08170 [Patescibacteria group bacterium]|nr:hypothetical protein [Patescibacteria group bacterium]
MNLRKHGMVVFGAAALILGLSGAAHRTDAASQVVTATIKFVSPGGVNGHNGITLPTPGLLANSTVFMDSYGFTWVQNGDLLTGSQGQLGAVSIMDSGAQLINFLTGNLRFNPGLEPLRVMCSGPNDLDGKCDALMTPSGKKNGISTVYIAMNVLVNGKPSAGRNPDGSFQTADAGKSSVDVTVVYQ